MEAPRLPEKHGADLLGAESHDEVDGCGVDLLDGLRPVVRDVDPDLGQRADGKRVDAGRQRPGALGVHGVAESRAASPSAIWLRAEFATQRKRTPGVFILFLRRVPGNASSGSGRDIRGSRAHPCGGPRRRERRGRAPRRRESRPGSLRAPAPFDSEIETRLAVPAIAAASPTSSFVRRSSVSATSSPIASCNASEDRHLSNPPAPPAPARGFREPRRATWSR